MRRGFTIVELLVAILIVSVILGAAYVTYITIIKGFGRETKSVETQIETAVGLELLRLDIEHAGYGIGEDQADLPVELDPSTNTLIIRSVLNNTRLIRDTTTGDPIHWSLVDCSGPGAIPVVNAGDDITNIPANTGAVFLGAANRVFVGTTTDGTCPDAGVFVAVPYATDVANGCGVQFCNIIRYFLSTGQDLTTCNPNTRNLLRAVGDSPGMPLLNCVGDIRFTFDADTNGDGVTDVRDADFGILDVNGDGTVTADEVRNSLKMVNVYVLLQEGGFDRGFRFRNFRACTTPPADPRLSGDCVVTETGVELNLPLDYVNYRWKVVKLSVIPMNL